MIAHTISLEGQRLRLALDDSLRLARYNDGAIVWRYSSNCPDVISMKEMAAFPPYAPGGIVFLRPIVLEDGETMMAHARDRLGRSVGDSAFETGVHPRWRTPWVCVEWTDGIFCVLSMFVQLGDCVWLEMECSVDAMSGDPWRPGSDDPELNLLAGIHSIQIT